jgi:hypothetical protein
MKGEDCREARAAGKVEVLPFTNSLALSLHWNCCLLDFNTSSVIDGRKESKIMER